MSESKTDSVCSPNTMKTSGTKIQDVDNVYTSLVGECVTISMPKYTWRCQLLTGTYWNVEEGKEPNWFHRKMQQLCFGIKWEKL